MPKKLLTKEEIEKFIESRDPSVKFVEQEQTNCTSELWQYYHHLFVNDSQQPFVLHDTCKSLLSFTEERILSTSIVNRSSNLRNTSIEYGDREAFLFVEECCHREKDTFRL
jgi:hypothetical protein